MSEAAAPTPTPTPTAEAAPVAEAPAAATSLVTEMVAAAEAQPSEPKPEVAPPAEGEKPVEAAPEFKFDELKLPEGVSMDDAQKEQITGLAKEYGLKPEPMQKLLDLHFDVMKKAQESAYRTWTDTNENWVKEVKADPEIGGDKLPGVIQAIGKLLGDSSLVDPGFRQALDTTGAGNNPAFVRTFYKIAQALGEGKPVIGDPATTSGPKPLANVMYPSLK